ncbi:hypothetical protein GGD64_006612 [Bradyrhizobium sp. CIR3A]|nr:hypothetical protein [Bradyrhizobium sp. CIR3A]
MARLDARGRRYAASAAGPWPDVVVLPAPGGFQVAALPRAGRLAAVVLQNGGPDAAAVRRCGAPGAAPWPVAAAWPVDGTPGRRDVPSRRRRRTGHGRRCCWPCCRRCGRTGRSAPSMSLAGSLGERADARRQHRDTNESSRKASAMRKHDCRSQLVIAHDVQRTAGGIVRCRPRPALRSSDAGCLKRNPASGWWRAALTPSRPGRL